jgi:uncharacterized protein YbaA (DUF1428 family)
MPGLGRDCSRRTRRLEWPATWTIRAAAAEGEYRQVSRDRDDSGALWIEHGALGYKECLADDVEVGEVTSFPRSVKLEDGETVIFAWISYESRKHRDEVNSKVMNDDRMKALMDPSGDVADMKRMVYGGFELLVDLDRRD